MQPETTKSIFICPEPSLAPSHSSSSGAMGACLPHGHTPLHTPCLGSGTGEIHIGTRIFTRHVEVTADHPIFNLSLFPHRPLISHPAFCSDSSSLQSAGLCTARYTTSSESIAYHLPPVSIGIQTSPDEHGLCICTREAGATTRRRPSTSRSRGTGPCFSRLSSRRSSVCSYSLLTAFFTSGRFFFQELVFMCCTVELDQTSPGTGVHTLGCSIGLHTDLHGLLLEHGRGVIGINLAM
jgi:hypothetical protein